MADKSHIEWTDATWNPITGCSVVSPGCTNCYAMKLAGTRLRHHPTREGLTIDSKAGPVWNGHVRLNESMLDQPLRWRRPRRIFVCAHGDLFHEAVPDAWIDRVFAVMVLAPQHTFQVLTKRPERMREYVANTGDGGRRVHELVCDIAVVGRLSVVLVAPGIGDPPDALQWQRVHLGVWPLKNVWLGVSAEDQTRADERIPILLDTLAAKRFVSLEPLLGPIDLANGFVTRADTTAGGGDWQRPLTGRIVVHDEDDNVIGSAVGAKLDWVIVGGESGPGARPMHPDWARQIRDDCAAAGMPFLFKQWGEWTPSDESDAPELVRAQLDPLNRVHVFDDHQQVARAGKRAAGRLLDGVTHDGFPA